MATNFHSTALAGLIGLRLLLPSLTPAASPAASSRTLVRVSTTLFRPRTPHSDSRRTPASSRAHVRGGGGSGSFEVLAEEFVGGYRCNLLQWVEANAAADVGEVRVCLCVYVSVCLCGYCVYESVCLCGWRSGDLID